MKKRWIILSALLLAGFPLAYFHQQFNITVPRHSREMVEDSEKKSARWYRTGAKLRGVALVVHGLNLKPERMEPLIVPLNGAGIDVLNLSLYGHGDNYLNRKGMCPDEARLDSFRSVTFRLWSAEMYDAYRKVSRRARQKKVPLFLVGYSLGGLLGCELQVSRPDVHFDRMVLLAPALKITLKPYLLKALMPFPDLVLDSLSPEIYRANAGTPMAGYRALFETLERFEKNLNVRLNVPTLIFLDREDEFISSGDLSEMIAGKRLDRWTLAPVEKDLPETGLYAHHLLIDEATVGRLMWSKMQAELLSHLIRMP